MNNYSMAMTPEEKLRLERLEKLVDSIYRVEDVYFIKNFNRRLELPPITLNDLSDVDTTGVSNDQVIKYNSTTMIWEPADDDIT